MAMEEKQHAGLLQFCLCDNLVTTELPSKASLQGLHQLFRAARRAADPKLSINEAFAIAIELEGSEVDVIHNRLRRPPPSTDCLTCFAGKSKHQCRATPKNSWKRTASLRAASTFAKATNGEAHAASSQE